ncbi:MAG: hypothetical protein AAF702_05435 [Chloroflexota bacterium]
MTKVARPKPHPLAVPRKPQGQATRGKTAQNRLRRVDNFLVLYDPGLIRRRTGDFRHAFFVDLGFGEEATTSLESVRCLRRLNPTLPVLGVEIDPERVANALPCAGDGVDFRLGGFNVPLLTNEQGQQETVRAIRAFNVLRQYDQSQVDDAYCQMISSILPGGLLIEGTSDPRGSLWVANIVRRSTTGEISWYPEWLVFSTNFRTAFNPAAFQAILPKNYIHQMISGQPIYAFFDAWKQAARHTISMSSWGNRAWFSAAADWLAQSGMTVCITKRWLNRGYLLVKIEP